jgi:hypothetical protein
MAEPGLADVHVDAPLTDVTTAYFLEGANRFAWSQVFPMVNSPKQSNKYYVFDKADLFRTEARKRAPNTEAPVRDYGLSTDTFFCDVRAVAFDVSEQVVANADPALDVEEDAARVLAQDMNIALEVDWAAAAFAGSLWGTTVTGNTNFTYWSDAAATPIEDITTGIKTVLLATGYKPNTLVLGPDAWYTGLANHPDIIARLPDNAPKVSTPGFLANLFNIDRVIIADAIRNTAIEGATASYSALLGKHALLCYVPASAGLRTPAAGYSFNWSGLVGPGGVRTKRIEIPEKDAYPRVEVETALDFKIVGSDLGYFFSGVVA